MSEAALKCENNAAILSKTYSKTNYFFSNIIFFCFGFRRNLEIPDILQKTIVTLASGLANLSDR